MEDTRDMEEPFLATFLWRKEGGGVRVGSGHLSLASHASLFSRMSDSRRLFLAMDPGLQLRTSIAAVRPT